MVEVITTDEFSDWYQALEWNDADAVTRVVGLLEQQGVALGFPHSSAIVGSKIAMRELRVQSRGRPLRVFYVFDPKRQAVLLLGGDKTGDNWFYERSPACRGALRAISGRGSRTRQGEVEGREEVAMAVHKWSELKKKKYAAAPERLERVEDEVRQELLELNLRAVRELVGKTQVEVAAATGMDQADVSKTERRDDHLLSTLRRYVEALGGELEVIARFGDKCVRLKGV